VLVAQTSSLPYRRLLVGCGTKVRTCRARLRHAGRRPAIRQASSLRYARGAEACGGVERDVARRLFIRDTVNPLGRQRGPETQAMEAVTETMPPVVRASAGARERSITSARHEELSPLSVVTLVIWLACVVVGTTGFFLRYARPTPPLPEPPPVLAQSVTVELTPDLAPPPPAPAAKLLSTELPPPAARVEAVPTPPALAVAEPAPTIAFTVPVAAPARIVTAAAASFRTPERREDPAPAAVAAPVPQSLVYGQGEGRQPAPEYPRQALREGQEGTVVVRFTVGPDGRVLFAEPATPSPWKLLNDSAVRVVRERWRFAAGSTRYYEVAIRFELKK
jgi:periplasmic protein TonB